MGYNPMKPWDPWGFWDNDETTDEERTAVAIVGVVFLAVVGGVCFWNSSVKNKHINEPVAITRSVSTDNAKRTIYNAEDTRGLFTGSYQFIVAKNHADSTYAEDKRIGLGVFNGNQVTISDHKTKGDGWSDPETMNYKFK